MKENRRPWNICFPWYIEGRGSQNEKCLNTFLFGIEEREREKEEVNNKSNLKLNCFFFPLSLSLFLMKSSFFHWLFFAVKGKSRDFQFNLAFFLPLSFYTQTLFHSKNALSLAHTLTYSHTFSLSLSLSHTHTYTHTIKEKGRR